MDSLPVNFRNSFFVQGNEEASEAEWQWRKWKGKIFCILLQMEIALCGGVFVPPTVLEDQNKMNKQKLLTINHKYS